MAPAEAAEPAADGGGELTPPASASDAPAEAVEAPPAPIPFEIHTAGYGNLSTSLFYLIDGGHQAIVTAVRDAAALLAPGLALQVYPYPDDAGLPCAWDPAANRSDHTSFQSKGFPACLLAEDLWTEGCPGDFRWTHPAYHESTDVAVDVAYASQIARVAAGAAWMIAR